VAELADAPDSKSGEVHSSCGFDPHLGHQPRINNIRKSRPFVAQFSAINPRDPCYCRAWTKPPPHAVRISTAAMFETAKQGHAEQSRSAEVEQRRKGWKKCQCAVVASGTLAGTSPANRPLPGSGTKRRKPAERGSKPVPGMVSPSHPHHLPRLLREVIVNSDA
jgi:hypothetical protein